MEKKNIHLLLLVNKLLMAYKLKIIFCYGQKIKKAFRFITINNGLIVKALYYYFIHFFLLYLSKSIYAFVHLYNPLKNCFLILNLNIFKEFVLISFFVKNQKIITKV